MLEDGIKSKSSGAVMAPSPSLAAAETLTKPKWASAGGKNAALITGFVQKGGGKRERERARYRKKDSQLHWLRRWSAAAQYKSKNNPASHVSKNPDTI